MPKHIPTLCILDDDPQRCLRQEHALDQAIAAKKMPVQGIANYGKNYLARSGMKGQFPALEFEGIYFTCTQKATEITYPMFCNFLDMLLAKGMISASNSNEE